MSVPKAIQIILARQLASCIATPVMLMDAEGTLIYYNEPAEDLINQRFEETGEIPAREWVNLVEVLDEERNPLAPEDRPMTAALSLRMPVSRTIWARGNNSEWRHMSVTAFPLVGEGGQLLGAMNIVCEV